MQAHSFSATLLSKESASLDFDALAKAVKAIVPDLEKVDVTNHEQGTGQPVSVHLDDIEVTVHLAHDPVRPSRFYSLAVPHDAWLPQDLVDVHKAHIVVSSGGDEADSQGLKNMQTHAAAVHVVTTAICDCIDIGAVFWDRAELFVRPEEFVAAVEPLMEGRMPVSSWVAFHPIKPDEYALSSAVGMITSGLRHFIGREIELAPSPTDLELARVTLGSVVQRLMDHHLRLSEGETIEDLEGALKATVRTRDRWLRRDRSAFVLVTDDSVIDQSTLRPDRRRGGRSKSQMPPAA